MQVESEDTLLADYDSTIRNKAVQASEEPVIPYANSDQPSSTCVSCKVRPSSSGCDDCLSCRAEDIRYNMGIY